MSRSSEARPVQDRLEPPHPHAPSPRKVFNRSSFEGDFLVVVPGQSAEDFEEFAPESRFCEYVEGTIYMPSPVSDRHQEWVLFLVDMLNGFRWLRGGFGQILMGPGVLRLSPERFLEPDLFIRDSEPSSENPPARFVLEVLSPSNRTYDLEWKSTFYQEARIPEIWYVDGNERAVVIDRLVGRSYERIHLTSGILISTVLAGFWIDVEWLWSDPLPNPRQCLDRILEGLPG